jgi:DNA replication regulator DPB11
MAPKWGVKVVAEEWLRDSVERDMVLDESLYLLTINPEQRGIGAWKRPQPQLDTVLGKRSSQEAELPPPPGKRKIRRALSKKLSSQRDAIWSDIATMPAKEAAPVTEFATLDPHEPALSNIVMQQQSKAITGGPEEAQDRGVQERRPPPVLKSHGSDAIFSGIQVHVYGFSIQKVGTMQPGNPCLSRSSCPLHASI